MMKPARALLHILSWRTHIVTKGLVYTIFSLSLSLSLSPSLSPCMLIYVSLYLPLAPPPPLPLLYPPRPWRRMTAVTVTPRWILALLLGPTSTTSSTCPCGACPRRRWTTCSSRETPRYSHQGAPEGD